MFNGTIEFDVAPGADGVPFMGDKRLKILKKPVATKTISNIEKDKHEKRSIRKYTLDNLAAGLRVRPAVLSGEEPLPAKHAPSDRVELQIDAQTRLNYDLIERRYNVSLEDVVNIAPVLFIKAAQESLVRQKRVLEEDVLEIVANISRMPGEPQYHSLDTIPDMLIEFVDNDDNCFVHRMKAIGDNDIFEWNVPYEDAGGYDPLVEPNPFAYYLQEMCASEIGHNMASVSDSEYRSYFPGGKMPICDVCYEDIKKIILGSHDAGLALSTGVVRIKDIPEKYWEPREAGNRVAWLEDEYAAAQKQNELDNDDES